MELYFFELLMAYYSRRQLEEMNFKHIGDNVKVSTLASIYDCENIVLNHNCRVDDFCLLSGKITIGSYVHITPYCLLAGGTPGITLEDFSTLAYGVYVFTQSDDYSGETMTNSLIPAEFKNERKAPVLIQSQSILGARAMVFPGCTISTGCAIGAMSLVIESTKPWGIYAGIPSKRIKERSKSILEHQKTFLAQQK